MKLRLRRGIAHLLALSLVVMLALGFAPKMALPVFAADDESAGVTISVNAGHENTAMELQELLSKSFPEGTEVTVEEDGITLSITLPADVELTTDDIVGILGETLLEVTSFEEGEHKSNLVGYKETYETASDLDADLEANSGKPLEDGQTFYVIWEKPISPVKITVDVPKCGYKVTGDTADKQNPKPDFTIEGKGVDTDPDNSYCFWWSEPSINSGSPFSGTVKHGDKLHVRATIYAGFGYYFDGNKADCYVNDVKSDSVKGTGTSIMFAGTVKIAEHDWGPWKVTKKPTKTSKGVETRVCKGDPSHKQTRSIPKLKPEPEPKPTPSKPSKPGDLLLAKLTAKGSSSLTFSWNKIKGADGYDIFFSKCNHNDTEETCKKIKTIKAGKALKFTKKGLAKGTAYKGYVKAFARKNGKKTYVGKSPLIHAYTSGGTRHYTNAKSVTVRKAVVSLKKGKTFKIKADVTLLQKGKKIMPAAHAPKLRYVTGSKKIATVSKSGKITAKAKGKCKIYVIAVNGESKTVQVTVK